MQLKSSQSLQSSALNDVKDIILLIGDSKKAKEQIELIAQDVVELKSIYQKNQDEVVKLSSVKADVEIKLQNLKEAESKNQSQESLLQEKNNKLNKRSDEIEALEKKINQDKIDFDSEYALKMQGIEAMRANALAEKQACEKSKNEYESLKNEYEEKLSKLKAMVG